MNARTRVSDFFDNYQEFLSVWSSAEDKAETDWEEEFIESLRPSVEEYEEDAFLSDMQLSVLRRLANK